MAITPDGCYAVSASFDHTLQVWDLSSGASVRVLEGHTGEVIDVAITAGGFHAISTSLDQTVGFWDLASGRLIATFAGKAAIVCCAISRENTIAAGATNGGVHLLRIS